MTPGFVILDLIFTCSSPLKTRPAGKEREVLIVFRPALEDWVSSTNHRLTPARPRCPEIHTMLKGYPVLALFQFPGIGQSPIARVYPQGQVIR